MIPIQLTGINILPFIVCFFMSSLSFGQADSIVIESKALGEQRTLPVHYSKNFNPEEPYQLFVVFDEATLFDYTSGVISYIAEWREMPPFAVVGIPNANRWKELQPQGSEPIDSIPFYHFFREEAGMLQLFRNASFRTLIGHSLSAWFATHFFLRNTNTYKGLVAVSPPFTADLREQFLTYYKNPVKDTYIYACSGEQDLRFHKNYFLQLQSDIKPKRNTQVNLRYFREEPNMTHTLMPVTAIKDGILFMMDDYFALPEKELKVHARDKRPADSLFEKAYSHVGEIYGLVPDYRTSDIQSYVDFYIRKKRFDEAHRLADFFIGVAENKEIYDLIDALYLKGMVFEMQKNYPQALDYYRKGYAILPDEVVNKQDFMEDIVRMEKRTGSSR